MDPVPSLHPVYGEQGALDGSPLRAARLESGEETSPGTRAGLLLEEEGFAQQTTSWVSTAFLVLSSSVVL